jgi:hypothetical protein
LKEEVGQQLTPNLVKPMLRKKGPKYRSGLHPFEIEIPERRSGAFRHKKYPWS